MGQIHDGAARDPLEDAGVGGRGEHDTLAHGEDIVGRALGDLAFMVEHQGLDTPGLEPLELGHDVVEVVERLDPWRERGRMRSLRGRGHDPQAPFVELAGIEADRVGDHDHLRMGGAIGVEAERSRAARDDEADIAIGEFVGGERVVDRLGHRLLRHRDFQRDRPGAVPEAVEVRFHPEHPARVAPHPLEDAVAVKEPMIEDADPRLRLGDETIVHEHDARHGCHLRE